MNLEYQFFLLTLLYIKKNSRKNIKSIDNYKNELHKYI